MVDYISYYLRVVKNRKFYKGHVFTSLIVPKKGDKMSKILYVDPVPYSRELVSTILGKVDHEVTAVACAEDALEELTNGYDLMIVNPILNDQTTGVELIEKVRSSETKDKLIPIIAVTKYNAVNIIKTMCPLNEGIS